MSNNKQNNGTAPAVETGGELVLFQFTNPELPGGQTLDIKSRTNDKGEVVGMSLTLAKRSSIAKQLNQPVKSAAVKTACRRATDTLASLGLAELAQGISSGLTGGSYRVAKSKFGVRKTLSIISPEVRTVTAEQMETAFASMSDAERRAFLAKVKEMKKSQPAVEV